MLHGVVKREVVKRERVEAYTRMVDGRLGWWIAIE